MCFWKKPSQPLQPASKRALLFAINNYPGTQNDLNGCINDQVDVEQILNVYYHSFDIRKFRDAQVTVKTFKTMLDQAVSVLRPEDLLFVHYSGHGTQVADDGGDEADGYDEALYLYDGAIIDDDIGAILRKIPEGARVVLALDSCFSGTATRLKNGSKKRFVDTTGNKPRSIVRKRLARGGENMNWVVFSGCKEDQTSADALINHRYNGAFSYFWLQSFLTGITYQQWAERTATALKQANFEQIPTLEGRQDLVSRVVFT